MVVCSIPAAVARLSPAVDRRCASRRVRRNCQLRHLRRRHLSVAFEQTQEQMADQPQHASLGSDPGKDPDQPVYHVSPRQGWANDGNGFIYYKGRYHM